MKEYLGDGVYVEETRGMLKLTTDRTHGEDMIFLEFAEFARLALYARDRLGWKLD